MSIITVVASVLVHNGGEHGGRYCAFIRPNLSHQWQRLRMLMFLVDDELVTKEDMIRALEEQYGGEEELPQTNGFNSTPFKLTKYSNAYMLVYIRKSDVEKVICNADVQGIVKPVRLRLKKEHEENEYKKKEAQMHTIIKVARNEDFVEQELKFEPSVMCEPIHNKLTFRANQLGDGDIFCFQKSPPVQCLQQCRYPDVPSFFEYVHNRLVVHFQSLAKPKEDAFCLQLSNIFNYDEVVESVARQLLVDVSSKIRLTPHNCYSQQPEPIPIRYRGADHLSDMLVQNNQTAHLLYYEVLDIPLPELECLKTLEVSFHHATKKEVELSHPNVELRLLEVFYHKIYKIPEEEKNCGTHDHIIHVYHFTKDTSQNQMLVQNFCKPFLLVIHDGETLADVKVRIQKKLRVPVPDLCKWKFVYISLGRAEYLQDTDIVSTRFQRRELFAPWEQYLGLEHSDIAPNGLHAANQNHPAVDLPSSKFTWTIRNFSRLNMKKHYSESFQVGSYKWRLLIYPKGNNVDYLSMYLEVAHAPDSPCGWSRSAQFNLSVVNQVYSKYTVQNGLKFPPCSASLSSEKLCTDTQHTFNLRESDWGFTSFMPLNNLCDPSRGFLVDDTLIFGAEVDVSEVVEGTVVIQQNKEGVPEAGPSNSATQQGRLSSCAICLDAPIEGACIPCGHMPGCMSCLSNI
ncbi:hypothetical protein IFM89_037538 [Coptis chinensis]|uniref:ubiquitinyl hydrolase 1 n=1 Tax=Coptis chinensis TaxID=261450 RepID=A0A835HVA6_9MAGN|nr:hypothetical protein IFM89_037538 [Coptis chinensis]